MMCSLYVGENKQISTSLFPQTCHPETTNSYPLGLPWQLKNTWLYKATVTGANTLITSGSKSKSTSRSLLTFTQWIEGILGKARRWTVCLHQHRMVTEHC